MDYLWFAYNMFDFLFHLAAVREKKINNVETFYVWEIGFHVLNTYSYFIISLVLRNTKNHAHQYFKFTLVFGFLFLYFFLLIDFFLLKHTLLRIRFMN